MAAKSANTSAKSDKEEKIVVPKKAEAVEVNPSESILKEQSATIELLQKQLEEMQKAFINMSANATPITTIAEEKEDKFYEISSRFIDDIAIFSPRKEIEKVIPRLKSTMVDEAELNALLKSNFVKDWFEKDILYIDDESVLKRKKIKKIYDLSDESLASIILDNTTADAMEELRKMTNNMKYDPMVHCMFYRIVDLCDRGLLVNMNFNTRTEIEKMFGFKISDAQMLYAGFRAVK